MLPASDRFQSGKNMEASSATGYGNNLRPCGRLDEASNCIFQQVVNGTAVGVRVHPLRECHDFPNPVMIGPFILYEGEGAHALERATGVRGFAKGQTLPLTPPLFSQRDQSTVAPR